MLPTKGYFQDIECPYFDTGCGRPYCHFRHRKKLNEENVNEPEKIVPVVPTYKPTPKSELANIHSKSHIPISYVPDLAFRSDRRTRPIPKFDKPTYKPTPLSILSSASKKGDLCLEENGDNETIKEIKQNIANNEYNPLVSLQDAAIDFEELSTEFDLIDEIIGNDEVDPNKEESQVKSASNIESKNKLAQSKEKDLHNTDDRKLKYFKTSGSNSEIIKKSSDKSEKTNSSENNLEIQSEQSSEKHSEKSSNKKSERTSEKHSEKSSNKKSEKSTHKHTEKIGDSNKSANKNKSNNHGNKEKSIKNEKLKEKHKEKPTSSSREKSHKTSSRDKHRKEEKKDRKEKHSSHKSNRKSRDRSKERSKDNSRENSNESFRESTKDANREHRKERNKERNKDHSKKDKNRDKHKDSRKHEKSKNDKDKKIEKEKHKNKSTSHKKYSSSYKRKSKHDSTSSSSEKSDSSDIDDNDNISQPPEDNYQLDDIDLEDADEDETMLECYKIFNEYIPEPKTLALPYKPSEIDSNMDLEELFTGKKRVAHLNAETSVTQTKLPSIPKPKSILTPGQTLTERYKIAKMAQASREQDNIIKEIKQPTPPIKRPAPSLLEAARQHKIKKLPTATGNAGSSSLIDDIINGKNTTPQSKPIVPKKIAPVQNFMSYQRAKERINEMAKQKAATVLNKTVVQTQKSGRVAHVPEFSLSDIPDVLQADKSKLPVNVRTRFLTMLADECVKLYLTKDDAYQRALNEEFSCYEKCKVLVTYRNSAMLAVNRLRKEIQERDKSGLGPIDPGDTSMGDVKSDYSGKRFYQHVKQWILTEEELDIHGYPRESDNPGKAIIKNRREVIDTHLDDNQRKCCRCNKIYFVDDDGWPLYDEECLYHPLKKRTIRGEQTYLCCRTTDNTGCVTSDTHVSESLQSYELEGYQTTMDPEVENDARSLAVYALDCEMCYTTKGLELTRVTIVDTECKTVYESLVKPLNPIIDYNTRFSGITKEQMDKTSTSILQIQANILHLCNSQTILVGHSLESDMKALKIVHSTIIDTAVLFPHKMGLPHKRALKALASEYLKKIIQNDVSGHDSAEDAVSCMELIKWKLKEELKLRGK